MNLKKFLFYSLIILLTIGASLTLGFLSFGGVYAALPIVGLALAGFVLSVAYEAEIYFQNILGAFKALFKFNYFETLIAKEFLHQELMDILSSKNSTAEPPQFFLDYEKQLHLAHNSSSNLERKKLKAMEEWFSHQLFPAESKSIDLDSDYKQGLGLWLHSTNAKKTKLYKKKLTTRSWQLRGIGIFSLFSGIFMGLGTTYLVMEVLTIFNISFLVLSIPGAVIPIFGLIFLASAAYAFLTYHAVSNMFNNDTLKKWYYTLKTEFDKDFTLRTFLLALLSLGLIVLAISLTVCTAGTWWTIAKEAQPFFSFMAGSAMQAIRIIMGIINPIFVFFSNLLFNLNNIKQTYDIIDEATKPEENTGYLESIKKYWQTIFEAIDKSEQKRINKENPIQRLNPFVVLLKITILPLRFLLFMGHIVSIGATADRMPGLPTWVSMLLGVLSEGFEDAHYFFDHHHDPIKKPTTKQLLDTHFNSDDGHNHDADIPTRLLKLVFTPIYLLAIIWDWSFSKLNNEPKKPLSFIEAFTRQTGWAKNSIPSIFLKILLIPAYLIQSSCDYCEYGQSSSFIELFKKHLDWEDGTAKHSIPIDEPCEHHHHHHHHKKTISAQARPSQDFELTHLIYKIEKHRFLNLSEKSKKIPILETLVQNLKNTKTRQDAHDLIQKTKSANIFNKHTQQDNFFAPRKTKTQKLLDILEAQTAPAA